MIGAVIMAHRARQEWAEQLSAKTGAPIHFDRKQKPTPDNEHRWLVGKRAWQKALAQGGEWSMVMQDDALASRDLLPGLDAAVSNFPDGACVSAYLGSGRPDQRNVQQAILQAKASNWSWVTTRSLNWGVCIVLPSETIPDMLEWCSTDPRALGQNYDYRIGVYYRDVIGWRTFYTFPSLVDHRDENSLVGHGGTHRRVAHNFLGEDVSALDIDWSRLASKPVSLNEPPKKPYYNPYWPKVRRDAWHAQYGDR